MGTPYVRACSAANLHNSSKCSDEGDIFHPWSCVRRHDVRLKVQRYFLRTITQYDSLWILCVRMVLVAAVAVAKKQPKITRLTSLLRVAAHKLCVTALLYGGSYKPW